MLSVLIPVYNYDVRPLVRKILHQLENSGIAYEIVILNDASTKYAEENRDLELEEKVIYEVLEKNVGRSEIRNLLCRKARYEWVLLMDCDTLPVSQHFIKNYIELATKNARAIFYGGISYHSSKPESHQLLRWIYGRKREALSLKKRSKNGFESALVSNLLIRKDVLLNHPFDASISDYGFEDFVFLHQLKKEQISIMHTDNPVYHENLEDSAVFLEKHLKALDNLWNLIERKVIEPSDTKLGKTCFLMGQLRLKPLISLLYRFSGSMIKRNLLSHNPSLFLFDFYKLGYFCGIKK